MITRNWQHESPVRDQNGIRVIQLYNQAEGQIMHISISARSELKSHVTPVNVAMYVLEGEPIIEIGDEKQTCPSGTMVESPKDIPHAIYNETDSTVRLLVMKLPRP